MHSPRLKQGRTVRTNHRRTWSCDSAQFWVLITPQLWMQGCWRPAQRPIPLPSLSLGQRESGVISPASLMRQLPIHGDFGRGLIRAGIDTLDFIVKPLRLKAVGGRIQIPLSGIRMIGQRRRLSDIPSRQRPKEFLKHLAPGVRPRRTRGG